MFPAFFIFSMSFVSSIAKSYYANSIIHLQFGRHFFYSVIKFNNNSANLDNAG